ncbi:MAG: glutamate ABC transporter substrate-binding protein [Actinomycetes bacterium]
MRAPRALATATAVALSLTLAACGGDDDGGEDTAAPEPTQQEFESGTRMAELQEQGSIKIGTKFDQPLFGLENLDGEPEGFDVEVTKAIAARLGIGEDGIEWVETVSANREPFLQQGQVDMVVATYTINEKRDAVIDFAGPYFTAGQDILVAAGNPEGIDGPDSLAGKKVCSVQGSTPAGYIQDNVPDAELVLFDVYDRCVDALKNGQVDAVTTDNVILSGFASEDDSLELLSEPFTEEPYGIGIPEGQEEFCEWINEQLTDMAESGELQEAFDRTAGEVIEQDVSDLGEPWGCDT